MIQALIVEDETLAAKRLEALLKCCSEPVEVIARLPSIKASVEWLRLHPAPDILFMDIHLEDGLSLAIFEQAPVNCPVIFTTTFDRFPLDKYNIRHAVYLPKPIQPEELQAAMKWFQEQS